LLKIFFGVAYLATFIFNFSFNVKTSNIAYIHSVYGAGVQTHDLLVMSRLPLPLHHSLKRSEKHHFDFEWPIISKNEEVLLKL
jgi:hypothetical protein